MRPRSQDLARLTMALRSPSARSRHLVPDPEGEVRQPARPLGGRQVDGAPSHRIPDEAIAPGADRRRARHIAPARNLGYGLFRATRLCFSSLAYVLGERGVLPPSAANAVEASRARSLLELMALLSFDHAYPAISPEDEAARSIARPRQPGQVLLMVRPFEALGRRPTREVMQELMLLLSQARAGRDRGLLRHSDVEEAIYLSRASTSSRPRPRRSLRRLGALRLERRSQPRPQAPSSPPSFCGSSATHRPPTSERRYGQRTCESSSR